MFIVLRTQTKQIVSTLIGLQGNNNTRARTSASEQVRQEHEHVHQNKLVSTHVYRGGGPKHKEDMP